MIIKRKKKTTVDKHSLRQEQFEEKKAPGFISTSETQTVTSHWP